MSQELWFLQLSWSLTFYKFLFFYYSLRRNILNQTMNAMNVVFLNNYFTLCNFLPNFKLQLYGISVQVPNRLSWFSLRLLQNISHSIHVLSGCYYVYQKTNGVHKSSSIEVYYQVLMVLLYMYQYYSVVAGCYYVYQKTNGVHKSSSIEIYYQVGQQQTQTNMLLELFVQIISEPCFNVLRTQEQLGRAQSC